MMVHLGFTLDKVALVAEYFTFFYLQSSSTQSSILISLLFGYTIGPTTEKITPDMYSMPKPVMALYLAYAAGPTSDRIVRNMYSRPNSEEIMPDMGSRPNQRWHCSWDVL
jgi:hypothetical protein